VNRWLPAFFLLAACGLGAVPLPPPLETGYLLGKGLPAGVPPLPLADELYALGWSPDNRFAYLERRTVDAGTLVRLRVLDTVDDTVVFEKEWPGWADDAARDAWWNARQTEIDALFTRFGLEPTDRQLGQFPLIVDNEFYTLVLRPARSGDWIDRLELVVHSTGRGLKTVRDGEGFWRWATLLGFVPSPFENRVALILLVQPAGWLGDKQPLRFLVSGLSLKAGFPQP
jgi:hypothetical protein